jgi:hypothetical protein
VIDPTNAAGSRDASTVYDGGATRQIVTVSGAPGLTASGFTAVAAVAGLKTKILGLNIYVSAFTSEGSLTIKDGAGGTTIFNVARFTALGQRSDFSMGGQLICMGSVNTLVEIFYSGTASIQFTLIYYQAP